MQRDSEIGPNASFREDQMASGLAAGKPTGLPKGLRSFFAGDIAKLSHNQPLGSILQLFGSKHAKKFRFISLEKPNLNTSVR